MAAYDTGAHTVFYHRYHNHRVWKLIVVITGCEGREPHLVAVRHKLATQDLRNALDPTHAWREDGREEEDVHERSSWMRPAVAARS